MYREGAWTHLNEIEEIGHYAVIVGYLRFYFDKPTVLDLGCGHGRLLQLLEPHFDDYTGIDISSEAINSARHLNIAGAHFVVSRFENFGPPRIIQKTVSFPVIRAVIRGDGSNGGAFRCGLATRASPK